MKNVAPLILSVVILVLLIGVYGFMYTRIADGIGRTEEALSRTESLSTRDALIRSQQMFLDDAEQERIQLADFVADDSQVIDIIELIEDTAAEEGVSVAISTVGTVARGEWQAHESIVVNFSTTGSFERMMRFIAALESLPIGSRLENALLEAAEDEDWFGTFSVVFVKLK